MKWLWIVPHIMCSSANVIISYFMVLVLITYYFIFINSIISIFAAQRMKQHFMFFEQETSQLACVLLPLDNNASHACNHNCVVPEIIHPPHRGIDKSWGVGGGVWWLFISDRWGGWKKCYDQLEYSRGPTKRMHESHVLLTLSNDRSHEVSANFS